MEALGSGRKAAETLKVLQQKIVSGEWPVNSKIPREVELMEQFGVGKSTVREAVRSLANLGMLEPIKGVGTFVRSRTPVSSILTQQVADFPIEQVIVYRRALEIEAAQQAALNCTEQQLERLRSAYEHDLSGGNQPVTHARGETPGSFHHLLFEAAGNELMTSLYTGVMQVIRRAALRGEKIQRSPHELRHLDHGAILRAIEDRDIVQAAHAMALHVDRDLVLDGELEVPSARFKAISDADLVPGVGA